MRRLLTVVLRAEGFRARIVDSGEAALRALDEAAADVVLLDLGLPDIDGIDLLSRLRARWRVPVLVLSARSDEADKVRALDAGANDYVTKPFGVAELMARLRVLLRTPPQPRRRRTSGG